MNELNMIRVLLNEAPPSAEVIAEGRRRIAASAAGPGQPGARRGAVGTDPRPVRPHRRTVRAAVACGAAAVAAVGVALAVGISGAAAPQARTGGSTAQARLAAYVTKRVENALASEDLVFVGRSGTETMGDYVTWAYGPRYRWEASGSTCGLVLANGVNCTGRGGSEPVWAQGTALVGGKLVGAYVTYFDRRYSLWPLGPEQTSACSKNAGLSMAAPVIPTSHWTAFIDATLACGAAKVTGHVWVGGVETTEITGKPITVTLSAGYSKAVKEKFATARWTLYVNPTTYLPVRIYGSTETFSNSSGGPTSSFVTNVQWLPPTPANVAQALVTIPPGFHRFYGPAGDQ
jgi:hypothetical protein